MWWGRGFPQIPQTGGTKKKHHTPDQIIRTLRTVGYLSLTAEGTSVNEAVRQIEVTKQTCGRWRRDYVRMSRDQ
jgi:hypothetical protein